LKTINFAPNLRIALEQLIVHMFV